VNSVTAAHFAPQRVGGLLFSFTPFLPFFCRFFPLPPPLAAPTAVFILFPNHLFIGKSKEVKERGGRERKKKKKKKKKRES
jgi:hypothetical protein